MLPTTDSAWVERITAQEQELTLPRFDDELAFSLGTSIRESFLRKYDRTEQGIVISVSLFTGHTLFACAVGNAPLVGADNWEWVRAKNNTVRRFGRSSFLVGRTRLVKGKPLDLGLGADYAAHGGAFPLNIASNPTGPIGAVTVSGLKQEDDHELVVDGLRALIASL